MGSKLADHQVLTHFQCPFQDFSSSTTSPCSYHSIYKSNRGKCPFGHSDSQPLREIPPYICFDFLTNNCTNETLTVDQVARSSWDVLARCTDGFHPSLEDLVDLEHLHQKMASHILMGDLIKKHKSEEGETDETPAALPLSQQEDQCSICLESVIDSKRNFGLLEFCDHRYCAQCILTWSDGTAQQNTRSGNTRKCPMCRTEAGKIAICQRLPVNAAEKAKLFEQQYKCLELARVNADHSDSDDDDDDNDGLLHIPEGRDELRLRLIQQLFEAISTLELDDDDAGTAARDIAEEID